MELIITEKDNAARRIADILSDGSATADRRNGVNVYAWGGRRCIGLSGHVVGVDFPPEYADWRDVEPSELVDASVVKTETRENIVAALRSLAREAESVVIATDYDREGELIGKEAYELVRDETEVPIRRVRFSSLTDREVTEAFSNPEELDFDLAAAGEARQIVDLLWGASLTRFLSLSAKQLGQDFISVGRVQSPTLKLIVDREREIEAFDPEDYWELFAELTRESESFEAQYFSREDGTEQERIWNEEKATDAHERLTGATDARVESVSRRTRTDEPPAPFNTTQFIRAAGSLGVSAQRAMSVAENLYTAGYVTYPRTDNTVYPDDLDERELLETFSQHPNFGEDAQTLLEQGDVTPTAGDNETTDHPPIHPTGEFPDELSDDEWRIYELVVRRFFATVAEPATWAHLKVVADANGCLLKANGKRLVDPGYHAVYPYRSTTENYVPEVEEGDRLDVSDVRLDAKQTQPPRRRGQSRLIERMEDAGLGTKCLTEDTLVLVRRNGGTERIPVGELFYEENVVVADGATDVAIVEDGPATISFDETTGRIEERRQTLVSQRPLEPDERVYEVTTETGTFAATGEHPVYCDDVGGFEIRTADELVPGDDLLAVRLGDDRLSVRSDDDSHAGQPATSDSESRTGEGATDATLPGAPGSVTVTSVRERDYNGPVYDLTVDETAPNFAVEGGVIVHNSTRHHTLQKLYDRGYVEGDPPRPTTLAMGVVEAAEEFADLVVSEEMTAQLEQDMTAIANGEASLDEVTDESREILRRVFEDLHESREEIGTHLRDALKQDKVVGTCPISGDDLLIRRSRRGSYFVGCDGFPECRYTLPLPNRGEPAILDETCEEHGLSHVKMRDGRNSFVHGCPRCQALEAQMTADEIIGACPECGEEHGGELAIKTLQSGSRLVGCTRYPDCEYSLPLPRRGEIVVTDEVCEEHDLPHLEVHDGDSDPWELGCPICNYEEYRERTRVTDLQDLDGVGEKTAERLAEAGVSTVDELRETAADELAAQVQGVSVERVREWQAQAGA